MQAKGKYTVIVWWNPFLRDANAHLFGAPAYYGQIYLTQQKAYVISPTL